MYNIQGDFVRNIMHYQVLGKEEGDSEKDTTSEE